MDNEFDFQEYIELDEAIKDLLFHTNMSRQEIALELGISQKELIKRIHVLGLNWVKRNNKKLSRGHAALTQILQRLIPGEQIVNEFHIGERLMLDIYCPKYALAIEYHGRQHFEYVEHFHSNMRGFYESQKRDSRKIELCNDAGITLVVFRYNDNLNEDVVYNRILEAIRLNDIPVPHKTKKTITIKESAFHESQKLRRRQYQKEHYQKLKKWRKNGD